MRRTDNGSCQPGPLKPGNRYGRGSQFLRRMLLPLSVLVTALVYSTASQELARAGLTGKLSPWSIAVPAGSVWLVWYAMLGLLRRLAGGVDHPPVDDRPLPKSRALLF